jgi:hypothetical protein
MIVRFVDIGGIVDHHCFKRPCKQSLTLTRAPITPRLVNLRYSKGLVLLTVCRNGYKNRGMCAEKQINKVYFTLPFFYWSACTKPGKWWVTNVLRVLEVSILPLVQWLFTWPFEYLRLTSLGGIGTLVKVSDCLHGLLNILGWPV